MSSNQRKTTPFKPPVISDAKVARVIDLSQRRVERDAKRRLLEKALTPEVLRELCGTDSSIRDCLDEIRNTPNEAYLPDGEYWDEIIWNELPEPDLAT